MTYAQVEAIFKRLYEELRESGGNAPDTNVEFSKTARDLYKKTEGRSIVVTHHMGSSKAIAYLFEYHMGTTTAVGSDASEVSVEGWFRDQMGLAETMPCTDQED